MSRFNRGVPGCTLIGLAALFALAVGGAGLCGLVFWLLLPADGRHFNGPFWYACAAATLGLLVAAFLSRLAVKVWRGTDFRGYDPTNPKDQGVKW